MSSTTDQPPSLIDRFAWIMKLIIEASASVKKEHGTVAIALVVLMQKRFFQLRSTFTHAYARGPIPQRARPQTTRPAKARPARPIPPTILPRCFGWALRMMPGTNIGTAQHGLKALLTDPAMPALVAANRAIGRTLRPLCHALGIRPPAYLRLPRRPSRPKPAPDPATQPPSPKPPARIAPKRPSPFPIPPPIPTAEQQKRGFLRMFGSYEQSGQAQDFTPPGWTYIHPRK